MEIIDFIAAFGLPVDPEGMCYGLAFTAARCAQNSCLGFYHSMMAFSHTLASDKKTQRKLKASLSVVTTSNAEETTALTPFMPKDAEVFRSKNASTLERMQLSQKLKHAYTLCQFIVLYMSPLDLNSKHHSIGPPMQHWALTQAHLESDDIQTLSQSWVLPHKLNIYAIEKDICWNNASDLEQYLDTKAAAHPEISLMLGIDDHEMSLIYSKKTWHFFDHDTHIIQKNDQSLIDYSKQCFRRIFWLYQVLRFKPLKAFRADIEVFLHTTERTEAEITQHNLSVAVFNQTPINKKNSSQGNRPVYSTMAYHPIDYAIMLGLRTHVTIMLSSMTQPISNALSLRALKIVNFEQRVAMLKLLATYGVELDVVLNMSIQKTFGINTIRTLIASGALWHPLITRLSETKLDQNTIEQLISIGLPIDDLLTQLLISNKPNSLMMIATSAYPQTKSACSNSDVNILDYACFLGRDAIFKRFYKAQSPLNQVQKERLLSLLERPHNASDHTGRQACKSILLGRTQKAQNISRFKLFIEVIISLNIGFELLNIALPLFSKQHLINHLNLTFFLAINLTLFTSIIIHSLLPSKQKNQIITHPSPEKFKSSATIKPSRPKQKRLNILDLPINAGNQNQQDYRTNSFEK